MLSETLNTPDLYLIASPRTDLIDEQKAFLWEEAKRQGLSVSIQAVHGKQRGGDVPRRIADAAEELSERDHAILLISHDMMTSIDLSPFTGSGKPWHARIDENPEGLASGKFNARAAAAYLEQVYDLEPSSIAGWWRVRLNDDAPKPYALMQDDNLRDLVAFDKRARSHQGQGLLVNVECWRDATVPGRTVKWYALWTPLALNGFRSVVIAAANFHASLCGLASQRWDGGKVTYIEHQIGGTQARAHPKVLIHFYTRGHEGSTAWWEQGQGRRCLNAVVRHLMTVPDLGYWSGNESVRSYVEGWLDHAEMVLPKQAGTNRLIHHTSCALIYSSKVQDADDPIREVFGLTKDEIRRAREFEDVIQFAMRGAIRDPGFSGTYTIYVYDETQALELQDYLIEARITDRVEVTPVHEAGIMDVTRPRSDGSYAKAEADPLTQQQREETRRARERERKQVKREEKREAAVATGTYRRPGRPRKA